MHNWFVEDNNYEEQKKKLPSIYLSKPNVDETREMLNGLVIKTKMIVETFVIGNAKIIDNKDVCFFF